MRDNHGGSERKIAKKRNKSAPTCPHEFTRITFRFGGTCQGLSLDDERDEHGRLHPDLLSAICDDRGAQLSLGESDEAPVAVEIRAAELAIASVEGWGGRVPGIATSFEKWGWECHAGVITNDATLGQAGWLARELVTHDYRETRDANAWPWDPTRALVGQYEIARMCDQDEAMRVALKANDLVRIASRALFDAESCPVTTQSVSALAVDVVDAAGSFMTAAPFAPVATGSPGNVERDLTTEILVDMRLSAQDSDAPTIASTCVDHDDIPIRYGDSAGMTPREVRERQAAADTVENTIREQTRHDVAASVARHSFDQMTAMDVETGLYVIAGDDPEIGGES